MDISLGSTLINCIIQDPKDRTFIGSVKRHLEGLSDEERDNDVQEIIKLTNSILTNNIVEKKEILFDISSRDFSDDIRANIDDETKFSKKFKKDILAKLSTKSSTSNIKVYSNEIMKLLDFIDINGGNKKGTDALYDLWDKIQELNKVAYQTKVSSNSGNLLIIDPTLPNGECTRNTLTAVLNDLRLSASNKIKTIKVIDDFVGGGFGPKSFNIFAAIGGNGKSLVLQNIFLYASKNNKREDFEVENGCIPCLVFVSLELTRKQLFQRQLAFCGIHLSDDEIKNMEDAKLETLVFEANAKFGFNIPIIYIERLQGEYLTSCNEIDDELGNLVNIGYQPVMVAIDYLDRLEVASSKHKNLGYTGAEGSTLLRQKGRECRDLAVKHNIPVVSAAQLNGEGMSAVGKVEPFMRKIDILHHFDLGMLAGSKQLQTEVETIVFCHRITIECRSQDEEILKTDQYIAMTVMKDRDGVSRYYLSNRDNINAAAYKRYTTQVRNNVGLNEVFKQTARHHTVIPLNGFKLDEFDYGRSIRMFYTGDQNEFVGINDLMGSYGGSDNVINSMDNYIPGANDAQVAQETQDLYNL